MSPRRTRRWGPLSRCTLRSPWLLPRQPTSQSEHKHSCHGDPVPVSEALVDWSGGESLAAESSSSSSMKNQISLRRLLKMDAWMFSCKPKHFQSKPMHSKFNIRQSLPFLPEEHDSLSRASTDILLHIRIFPWNARKLVWGMREGKRWYF